MRNEMELKLATADNAQLLHKLQVEAFMPLYEKYHDDDMSPAKESLERVREKIEEENSEFYLIYFEKRVVGGIRIRHHHKGLKVEHVSWISPLFIIPAFQNRGIAKVVIEKVFELYPETLIWRLDTIKEEKGNCHLYEKCGFIRVGEEHVINEQMTLVDYEKSCITVRRFKETDAENVSRLVRRNMLEVNSKDYGLEAMQKVAEEYSAEKILQTAGYAHMYVFEWREEIVGVGAISSFWGSETESILLTIFVLPELHGKGIGRTIIDTLEKDELYTRAERIEIPASITGVEFYRKFGYDYKNGVRELDDEGNIRLEKFR